MLPLVQESLEGLALEALLSALLVLETHLPPQVDRGDRTTDLGGDPNTGVFLGVTSALDTLPSYVPRLVQ